MEDELGLFSMYSDGIETEEVINNNTFEWGAYWEEGVKSYHYGKQTVPRPLFEKKNMLSI